MTRSADSDDTFAKFPLSGEGPDALKSHLKSILESVPDAMIVIDESGSMLAFSHAAEALFGYRAEDILGQNVSLLMTERDSAHHDDYISRYMQTGEGRIIGVGRVVYARRADGEEFPVDLKIGDAPIGGRHLFTAFIRDLSEQQAVELRMKQMQAELVHFSRMNAVGTMAAALAHELNQPLTAIANYLEAGRDLLDDPEPATIKMVQEALDEASRQSLRAGEIVRRLRDFVARGEIDAKAVDFVPLLKDAVALAKLDRTLQGLRIDQEFDPDVGRALVDGLQIQQVVINLIRNAIDALAGRADGHIRIAARALDAAIEVTIEDNGDGIAEELADELFKPFNSSKAAGMGLGLSICKAIVESHGGEIAHGESALGGACFTFTVMKAPETATHD